MKFGLRAYFYGQATASEGEANTLINALDLQSELEDQLTTPPVKGLPRSCYSYRSSYLQIL